MSEATLRAQVAHDLTQARARTLALTDLADHELTAQANPLMSPLVWDLAHISQQEDLWLLRAGDDTQPGILEPAVERLYDAFRHGRAGRAQLPLLPPVAARVYGRQVRDLVLAQLERADPTQLFAYSMVAQHEQQHDETMAAARQLTAGGLPSAVGPTAVGWTSVGDSAATLRAQACEIPAGPFQLGVDPLTEPWALDNERPQHWVEVPGFALARWPVTNHQWWEFMADGGYRERRWWSAAGWEHAQHGLVAPLYWGPDGTSRRLGEPVPIAPAEPVQHVSFYEAEAFARWAGGRLPSEVEWEKACAWDPAAGRRRRWPWGQAQPTAELANLQGLGRADVGPSPAGSRPLGASAYGVEQLIGDVWEWTSSPLQPWPGFEPMLYRDYSRPFFGPDHRVLRGGSWAVGSAAIRPSFRNWDLPQRRQIFCGLRLAWDL